MKINAENFDAVAFDFDCTLADSFSTHMKARMEAFKEQGYGHITEAEHAKGHTYGTTSPSIIGGILKSTGVINSEANVNEDPVVGAILDIKMQKYSEIVQKGVDPIPGAIEFVANLPKRYKLAIVTTASLTDVLPFLEKHDLRRRFNEELLITEETAAAESLELKPAPDEYELARKRLGIEEPARMLAVEDSTAGIESAKRAGATVLALLTTNSREVLEAMPEELKPDYIVKDFTEVSVE